jgi:hypothetical protein
MYGFPPIKYINNNIKKEYNNNIKKREYNKVINIKKILSQNKKQFIEFDKKDNNDNIEVIETI